MWARFQRWLKAKKCWLHDASECEQLGQESFEDVQNKDATDKAALNKDTPNKDAVDKDDPGKDASENERLALENAPIKDTQEPTKFKTYEQLVRDAFEPGLIIDPDAYNLHMMQHYAPVNFDQ